MAGPDKNIKPEDQIKALETKVSDLETIVTGKDEVIAEKDAEIVDLKEAMKTLAEAKDSAEKNAKVVPSKKFTAKNGGEYRFKNGKCNFTVPRMGSFTAQEALKDEKVMNALIRLGSGYLECIKEPTKTEE